MTEPTPVPWTTTSAREYLQGLINTSTGLGKFHRTSAEWTRWRMNALSFLEEVFGKQSVTYRSFSALPWGISGRLMFDTDDMKRRAHSYQLEGTNEFIERKNQEAAVAQLETAKGLLLGALDDLNRKGVVAVRVPDESGKEASDLLRVMHLVEHQWRKVIHAKPESERDVQNAFENLLVGATLSYRREAEAIPYASKVYRPDFTIEDLDLAIEIKLCPDGKREKEMIAEINDDILAYSTRYKNLLFGVYDLGFIRDVDRFVNDFENKPGVLVRVIKH